MRWISKALRLGGPEADKRVWKTVKCQDDVMEKSGNLEIQNKWQP